MTSWFTQQGEVIHRLCVNPLTWPDRVRAVARFASTTNATIVLIGSHEDSESGFDAYAQLYELAGIFTGRRSTSPRC